MDKQSISVIVPTFNEEGNISVLVDRINRSLASHSVNYEIIFIDDHSTDATRSVIKSLTGHFPIRLFIKKGQKGKAFSLLEGFKYTKKELIAILDADLQYPPEALGEMIDLIKSNKFSVVIASRTVKETNYLRKLFSRVFRYFFATLLFGLDFDVQSGFKVFKTEVIQGMQLNPSPWTFDLEFLVKARRLGYKLGSVDILFAERTSGVSKINLLSATTEIALSAINLRIKLLIRDLLTIKRPGFLKSIGRFTNKWATSTSLILLTTIIYFASYGDVLGIYLSTKDVGLPLNINLIQTESLPTTELSKTPVPQATEIPNVTGLTSTPVPSTVVQKSKSLEASSSSKPSNISGQSVSPKSSKIGSSLKDKTSSLIQTPNKLLFKPFYRDYYPSTTLPYFLTLYSLYIAEAINVIGLSLLLYPNVINVFMKLRKTPLTNLEGGFAEND